MIAACLLSGLVCWSYQYASEQLPAAHSWRPGIGTDIFEGARFRPEQTERHAFLLFCAALPATCILSLAIVSRFERSRSLRWLPLAATMMSGAGLGYVWIVSADDRGVVWSSMPSFVMLALLFTAFSCMLLLATRRFRTRKVYAIVAELAALVTSVFFACYEISPGWMSVYATAHLEPILFPVVQVLHGRTLLVDTQSMYGLYPHFLECVFRVVPLSMATFSLVMGVLLFLTLFSIYRFLRLTTPGPFTALIAFLGYLLGPFSAINAGYPHYQCYPLRALFPALVLWLGARYVKQPTQVRLVALAFTCGLALLWNLDSGIACLGGSIALICGECAVRREAWRQRFNMLIGSLAKFSAVVVAVILIAVAYLFIRSGEIPQLGNLFTFQSIFYRDGFLMEPMKPLGGWWILAVVYVWAMTSGFAGIMGLGDLSLPTSITWHGPLILFVACSSVN